MIPFYIKGATAGTIWVISHDETRRFDAEDLRVLKKLGIFASVAYQNLLAANATQSLASIVDTSDDAVFARISGALLRRGIRPQRASTATTPRKLAVRMR